MQHPSNLPTPLFPVNPFVTHNPLAVNHGGTAIPHATSEPGTTAPTKPPTPTHVASSSPPTRSTAAQNDEPPPSAHPPRQPKMRPRHRRQPLPPHVPATLKTPDSSTEPPVHPSRHGTSPHSDASRSAPLRRGHSPSKTPPRNDQTAAIAANTLQYQPSHTPAKACL